VFAAITVDPFGKLGFLGAELRAELGNRGVLRACVDPTGCWSRVWLDVKAILQL
jgi:hypothetical protein